MAFITFCKMKRYIIFCFILLLSVQSFAQETSFSKDVDQFLIELEIYLNRTKNDEIKQISKQISKNFHNGDISLESRVIVTSTFAAPLVIAVGLNVVNATFPLVYETTPTLFATIILSVPEVL